MCGLTGWGHPSAGKNNRQMGISKPPRRLCKTVLYLTLDNLIFKQTLNNE
jgi:hypothetical protein